MKFVNSLNSKYLYILSGVFLTCVLFLIFNKTGFDKKAVVLLLALPVFIISLFNINAAIAISISLLFAQIDLFGYRLALYAIVPVLLSYLINYKTSNETIRQSGQIPFLLPYIGYIIFMAISLTNCTALGPTLKFLSEFIFMSILFFILKCKITNYKQITVFAVVFLVLCALNGAHVLFQGLTTGDRVFGFMGVTFVDFVCVAIIITLVVMFYQKKNLIFLSLLTIFFLVSLFLTQTRNVVLALSLTLITGAVFLFFYSEKFTIPRKSIIKLLVTAVIALTVFTIFSFTVLPGISERFSQLSSSEEMIDPDDFHSFGKSSLVTRLLIWLTCLNGFREHPFIGIGSYSFRFQSLHYNVIPLQLYKMFVDNFSPHLTYLAILTETGILGLISFLFFLFSTIKMTLTSFKKTITSQQTYYTFGILLLQFYVAFSMCFTDAWLFGQCGILWGFILGIGLANYYIVKRNTIY